jgi:hypothetical protein
MVHISRILMGLFAVIAATGWCLGMALICYWAVLMLGAGDGTGPSLLAILSTVGGSVLVLFLPLMAFVLIFVAFVKRSNGGAGRFTYWYVLIVLVLAGMMLPVHGSMRYSWFVSLSKNVCLAGAVLWGIVFWKRAEEKIGP